MDAVFGRRVADDEFVRRRTASMLARFNDQRPLFRQMALSICQSRFDQLGGPEIPEDICWSVNALFFKCDVRRIGLDGFFCG